MRKTEKPAKKSQSKIIFPFPPSRLFFLLFLCLTAYLFTVIEASSADLDFSPFYRYNSSNHSESRLVLGPFFEQKQDIDSNSGHKLLAIRPFFSRFETSKPPVQGWDFLWPLAASRTREDGHYTYFLNFLHTSKPDHFRIKRQRWWLWPFFFSGLDKEGAPYFALFPVAGKISNLGFFEEFSFFLFPLYSSSRQGNLTSQSLLWPIFGRSKSPGGQKWRIFPLYGVNHRKNSAQRFIFWPFIHIAQAEKESLRPHGFLLFPIYGQMRQHDLQGEVRSVSRTVLWPFFKYKQGPSLLKLHAPWPLYQKEERQTSEGAERKLYLWPFYGERIRPESNYHFALWPIFHHRTTTGPTSISKSIWIAPFWQQTKKNKLDPESKEIKEKSVSRRLWPVFQYYKTPDVEELTLLDLWPLSTNPAIERNYSPLWKLYKYRTTARREYSSLLWGCWLREKGQKGSRHRIFPLFDYNKKNTGKRSLSLFTGLFEINRDSEKDYSTKILWFIKL